MLSEPRLWRAARRAAAGRSGAAPRGRCRRRAAAARARRADHRGARPRPGRAGRGRGRRERHRDGRRIPESVAAKDLLGAGGRCGAAASATAGWFRPARCARRSPPQLARADALVVVGSRAMPAKRRGRRRARDMAAGLSRRPGAGCGGGRGACRPPGARLRRHRRSAEVLRARSRAPASRSRRPAAFPTITATRAREATRFATRPIATGLMLVTTEKDLARMQGDARR